ncbi:MAG: hypothetical protein H0U54_12850 [Acidobacteria bacterium]|nr:hypothetical protein [Acidobacteriota bacterium]
MAVKKEGTSGKSGSQAGRKKQRAPTQDPIIITGGSVKLEYANKSIDGFRDNGSGGGKKKLKHKRNREDNPEETWTADLTCLIVTDTAAGTAQTIDLRRISDHCRIEIFYDFE